MIAIRLNNYAKMYSVTLILKTDIDSSNDKLKGKLFHCTAAAYNKNNVHLHWWNVLAHRIYDKLHCVWFAGCVSQIREQVGLPHN